MADDTLVFGVGDTDAEARAHHDRKLRALFDRVRKLGIRPNKRKLQLGRDSVRYMGHIISRRGVAPDPEKVKAITEMPKPQDAKAVMRFLGMANYLLRFVPSIAELTAPLRDASRKAGDLVWSSAQQTAFEKIKRMLAEAPTLSFFDPRKEVTIHTDASEIGIGAILSQGGQPVAYHYHALSPTEQRYATVEKECLAIVSACLKFDHLIFGEAKIRILSDHKPL